MPLLRRANEQTATDWLPIPAGVWRFHVNLTPDVKWNEKWNGYAARFTLQLVPSEVERLHSDFGQAPDGSQWSIRAYHSTGLSLGFQKNGQYQSTKLTDFLSACLGVDNVNRFYAWIESGGGPPKGADPNDPEEELALIAQWLGWFEGLELYGSIRHEKDAYDPKKTWPRFGGPMPIGSLPKQPREDDYQALALGKLRSMIAEYEESLKPTARPQPGPATGRPAATADRPPQRYHADGSPEMPF